METIEKNHSILRIGKTGENAFRTFSFNVSKWMAEYPHGEITAVYRRPDDLVYPVNICVQGTTAHWTITAAEAAVAGSGELELRITQGDVIGKSARFPCIVSEALTAGEEPPEAVKDWITLTMHDAKEAAAAAKDATNELLAAAERGDFNGEPGPRGDKGDKGDKGDPGEDGKNGKDYVLTDADKAEIAAVAAELVDVPASPKDYGAIGLGATDDTAAFKQALSENRTVHVPGGRYVISDTLVVRENCCLELSQDTVLEFVNEEKNAITLLRAAHLRGNHATITVPYTFSANVIHCDTGEDEAALDADATDDEAMKAANNTAVPPFAKWDPQWKMTRYVTDVNICKPDNRGFHYSKDGDCYGTAIYLHCDVADYVSFMWGVSMSGVRIAGGFEYGIRACNIGDTEDSWNHDMQIEALIDACKVGVSMENCHYARLAVTVQPRRAYSDSEIYRTYAEHGILLKDSKGIDLSGSRVWDWSEKNTLWAEGNYYQHIAMLGDCRGLILDDFLYHAQPSIDIRRLIYTDTPSNLENMTVLQEPIDRWFKTKGGEPYFYDGYRDRKLVSQEEMDAHFGTDFVKSFTDVLATAEDTDGTVLNGVGYKMGARLHENGTVTESAYYGYTGFIPCATGSTIYAKDLTFDVGDDYCKVIFYDAGKNYIRHINRANIVKGNYYFAAYTSNEDGFSLTVNNVSNNNNVAYARFTFYKTAFGESPMMAVDEEIKYTVQGFLSDNVKVKAKNVVGLPDGGAGAQPDWSAAEGEPGHVLSRTHYEDADGTVHKLDNKFIDAEWMAKMVEAGEEAEILPERTISFTSNASMVIGDSYKLSEGGRYAVYWNGTEYICTAVLSDGGDMLLGNAKYYQSTMTDTGKPFCFTESGGSGWVYKSTSTAENIPVQIVKLPDIVPDKLPEKFLPDGVVKSVNGTAPDENGNVTIEAGGGNANIDVIAEVGQTIVVLAVDDYGKPTLWGNADYQERTHWSEIAEVDIIPVCDVTPVLNEDFGLNVATLAPFELTEGNTYTIGFDGKAYTCIAKTGDTPFQYIGIGNAAFVGGENTGEPFIIAHLPTFGMYCVLCADTNTHNVVVIGEKVVYHQIPDGYVPSDNYKVTFYMNADGTTSMANEWDDVVAAIEAGKNVYGEKVLSSVYSNGGECKTTMRLRFLYMKKNNNAYDDDKIAFESYIGTGIIVIRSYETGEITIGDDSQIPG